MPENMDLRRAGEVFCYVGETGIALFHDRAVCALPYKLYKAKADEQDARDRFGGGACKLQQAAAPQLVSQK